MVPGVGLHVKHIKSKRYQKKPIVIIGGSGFEKLLSGKRHAIKTDFGKVSALVSTMGGREVFAIKRHGDGHKVPPHLVNYKGIIYAAHKIDAEAIFASTAVGVRKSKAGYKPGDLILGNDINTQFIRFPNGPVTFCDEKMVLHADFSEPFSRHLNKILMRAARELRAEGKITSALKQGANLITFMGPKYESPSEIYMAKVLGAHLIGMTTGFEAVLAAELRLICKLMEKEPIPYAIVAIGTNWAAGTTKATLSHSEVETMMARKSGDLLALFTRAIEIL